jgi:hypothetical protein
MKASVSVLEFIEHVSIVCSQVIGGIANYGSHTFSIIFSYQLSFIILDLEVEVSTLHTKLTVGKS